MAYRYKREYVEKMFVAYSGFLRPEEAGKCLRLGKNTVYQMLQDGMLPHVRVKGRYCIYKEALIDYVIENSYGDVNRRVHYNERIVEYCRKQPRTASKVAEYIGLSTGYCRSVLLNPLCSQGSLRRVVSSENNNQKGLVMYQAAASRSRKWEVR